MAGKFFSSSRYVWKHGNLSTDAGGSVLTGERVRSALGARHHRYIYIPSKKIFTGDGREIFSGCRACVEAWNLSRRCGGPRFDLRKGSVWRSALGTIVRTSARRHTHICSRLRPRGRVAGDAGYKSPGLNCSESALAAPVSQRRRP